MAKVHVGLRPLDNPVPLALADARMGALVNRSDHLWVRVLDVPAALTSRRYAADGSLVLEVVGALGATYLGGTSWGRLAALGWVDERADGATALAAAMFGAPRAPWCVLSF